MKEDLEIINFLQDFGCARLKHLQILFSSKQDNFNRILTNNLISKKDDIFVFNNTKINENMLIALDILCKYKGRYVKYYINYEPVFISFLSNENNLYHIIVADETTEEGIIKRINNPSSLPDGDKFILAFRNDDMVYKINTSVSFLYCTYPGLEIIKQV